MRSIALLVLSLAALAAPAFAQEIPGRVGRVAWTDGDVALYQDPDRGWEQAYLNSPITSRNSLWTDSGARAEAQVGAIALRMDELSQLDVSRLDDDMLDATLEQGTLAVRVHHRRPGEVIRLSTPQASFTLDREGHYRLDADPDGAQSRLSVFSGSASLQTAGGRVRIRPGDSIVVWGEDSPSYAFEDAELTGFDRWAEARDERWIERRAPEYVSFEMTGYEDLDAYGEWSQDPVFGVVWFPTNVREDWAPYRYGRWTYVEPWGWTWVDAEPWGYAPFHYGRWVQIRGRWAWCPGHRVANPTWAPALVGFIGGSGWSVSAESGGPVVGWYPLAPSERYRPWYRASRKYETQVNAAVIQVPERVAREHRESNRDHAATAVRRDVLVAQKPVAPARVALAPQAVRAAPAIAAPAAALPGRNDVREAHRAQAARNPVGRVGPPAARAPAVAGERSAPGAARNAAPTSPPVAANGTARPSFAKPRVAPKAAPKGTAPPPPPGNAIARGHAPNAASPSPSAARGEPRGPREDANANRARESRQEPPSPQPQRPQGEERSSQARDRAAREAAQRDSEQAQQRARNAAEAQQRAARQAEQHAAQEAKQQAARDAEQRAAQERQQRDAREAQQREEKNAAEAQQRASEQRAAREAQQRAAQEARQHAAQEAQQHAAQEARQHAAQEAQQHAAQEAQQRASREAEQRAAQEAKHAAQEAQQKARAAHEKRPAPDGEEAAKDKQRERGGENRGQ